MIHDEYKLGTRRQKQPLEFRGQRATLRTAGCGGTAFFYFVFESQIFCESFV